MSNLDKRLENTVPASTLNLDDKNYEGRVFRKVQNGELTVVRLVKVKRRDVYLEYVQGERADGFSVTQAAFRKFYHLVNNRKADTKADV